MSDKYTIKGELPIGFGLALAQNIKAMEYFSRLPDAQKQTVIDQTHGIQSSDEMRRFVNSLVDTVL